MFGQQAVALPEAADAAGGELGALQHKVLGHSQRSVAGMRRGVAEAVVWLASAAASYIVGHILSDGGGFMAA